VNQVPNREAWESGDFGKGTGKDKILRPGEDIYIRASHDSLFKYLAKLERSGMLLGVSNLTCNPYDRAEKELLPAVPRFLVFPKWNKVLIKAFGISWAVMQVKIT